MLDDSRALACADVLSDGFLEALSARGIDIVPASYKEARSLGGNILSIDGKTVLIAARHERLSKAIRDARFDVREVDISQFAACGGGIHCLTLPLSRAGPDFRS